MNIPVISSVSSLFSKKQANNNVVRQQGLSQDTFVRTLPATKKTNFDVESAVNQLKEITAFNGKLKFNEEKLEIISQILKENPEKWEAVKTISEQPKMISSLVLDFAKYDSNTLDAIAGLSVMKNENGKVKFSPLEIRKLAGKLDGEGLTKIGQLANAPIDSEDMITITKDKNLTDMEKLVEKIQKFAKSAPNMRRISFAKDDYDDSAYVIRADMADNGSKILLLDKDLNETAVEIVEMQTSSNGTLLQIKKNNDFRNNTVSKVTATVNPRMPMPVVTEEIRLIKDENGKIIRKELYSLSDVAGTPNIKHIYPDGTEKIISSGEIEKNTGITTVKKDMVGLDGTRTEYLFEDDPSGNMISEYKVTDKNGNVLFDNNLTFMLIDDKTYISTENDKKYEIKLDGNQIKVKNLTTNEVTDLELDERADGNIEKLKASLKRMPAEEIISLGRTTEKLTGIDNTYQSTYAATTKTINSGDNLFTILHEAGHAKDYEHVDVKKKETLVQSLFSNPEVNKIFEQEKAAFNNAFPLAQREHISYFIKSSEHKDGLQEAIAETNALLNTKNTEVLFSVRSHYLQQYFPRTIVLLSKLMD